MSLDEDTVGSGILKFYLGAEIQIPASPNLNHFKVVISAKILNTSRDSTQK